MARKDRARYEMEKTTYTGPWKVPAKKRSLKDPNAPKRPMSAYLAFSNSRRAEVKRQNPDMGNAELSRLLSTMWKEAPAEVRQKYIDKEFTKRQAYNSTMAAWKKNSLEERRAKRELREEVALRAVEASELIENKNIGDTESAHMERAGLSTEQTSVSNGAGAALGFLNQRASRADTSNLLLQRWPWDTTSKFQP